MPYVRVSVSKELGEETAKELTERMGKAINNIPEKIPPFTMVELCDGAKMYLGGEKRGEAAYIEIKYYGEFPYEQRKAVAEDAIKAVSEMAGIPVETIYLTITELDSWGIMGGFTDSSYTE